VRRAIVALLVLALTGCASGGPPRWIPHPTSTFAFADGLLEQGDYEGARRAYDELLEAYPGDREAGRARATRDAVTALLSARAEMARLREAVAAEKDTPRLRRDLAAREAEIARVRTDLAAREAELAKLRHDLTDRQAEVARLTSEAEQLRVDLEKLKNVDIRLERRR
jgi:chromosome segregation ATPase